MIKSSNRTVNLIIESVSTKSVRLRFRSSHDASPKVHIQQENARSGNLLEAPKKCTESYLSYHKP